MDPGSPLPQILHQAGLSSSQWSFANALKSNRHYARFKQTSNLQPTLKAALSRFLKAELTQTITEQSLQSHLTALIPMSSRKVPGLLLADISLAASVPAQGRLLQYRRGVFLWNFVCICNPQVRFRRGHEECSAFECLVQLSQSEQCQKQEMKLKLSLLEAKFTNVDFLLNIGQLQ